MEVQWVKKRQDKLQRLVCFYMTGVENSVAMTVLEMLLHLTPLDLYIKSVNSAALNVRVNECWNASEDFQAY